MTKCKAEQPLMIKDFELKYFLEVKLVLIGKKPLNNQSDTADFYLWSLLLLGSPKNAKTKEYFE